MQWWWLLSTALVALLLFNIVPTLLSFAWIGLRWDLLNPPQWVGWQNVLAVLGDSQLGLVLQNTAFLVVSVTLCVVLASAWLAWQLAQCSWRTQQWLKACYFLPYVTPSVAISLVFGFLLHPEGLLNQWLVAAHWMAAPMAFLQHPQSALPMIALLDVWKLLGYNVLLMLAGLQQLPKELFEAARLDGCPRWQQGWRIALPNLWPTVGMVTMTVGLQALQTFDSVYLLTQGGPSGRTQVLTFWLFKQAFWEFNTGQASVVAFALIFLVGVAVWLKNGLRKH